MKIEDIDFLLSQIRKASGLDEFVVIGSLSALGIVGDQLPPRMTWSMKMGAYPERAPACTGTFRTIRRELRIPPGAWLLL